MGIWLWGVTMFLLDGLYSGIKSNLEEQANAILREGRKGVTALSEKKDYLTEEQLSLRQAREVLNSERFPTLDSAGPLSSGAQPDGREATRPSPSRGLIDLRGSP